MEPRSEVDAQRLDLGQIEGGHMCVYMCPWPFAFFHWAFYETGGPKLGLASESLQRAAGEPAEGPRPSQSAASSRLARPEAAQQGHRVSGRESIGSRYLVLTDSPTQLRPLYHIAFF